MKKTYRVLISSNLGLGLFLWFLFSTEYSLRGTISDIVFPPIVMIIGLISYKILKQRNLSQPSTAKKFFFPSILGGCLPTLFGIIMFLPPFTLGGLFMLVEIQNETVIQETVSPNGLETASVYFRGVGAYGGGNGHIYVRITNKLIPLLERDVFYLDDSYASMETYPNYVTWQDNNTLAISETDEALDIRLIRFEVPQPIASFIGIGFFVGRIIVEEVMDYQKSALVRAVPCCPGDIYEDKVEYFDYSGSTYRFFRIGSGDPDDIAFWYKEALSEPPYEIIETHQHLEGSSIQHCLIADVKSDDGETNRFYVEISGRDNRYSGGRVHISFPKPIGAVCYKYLEE